MKSPVIGVVALSAVVFVAVRGVIEFINKLNGQASAKPPALPLAPPRRALRNRKVVAKAASAPPASAAPVPPAPSPPSHLDASTLQVTRPARARTRPQFFGRSALRQAIVAREVLGPPLALRPPRS